MEYRHETVLRDELLDVFLPVKPKSFLDGTLGGGGFSLALLKAAGASLRQIGLDVDPAAIAAATERLREVLDRCVIMRRSYTEVAEVLEELGMAGVDAMTLDLGISSALLEGPRGFSFRQEGPLDMRMDPESPVTAKGILDVHGEPQLADVFYRYGEIRGSRRLARVLKQAVRAGRMQDTKDLVDVVQENFPNSGSKLLARVFQALRIAVNSELENVESFLAVAPHLLNPGGRLAIISFHSLEDRIVKHTFRDLAKGESFRLGTRKPVLPSAEEVAANPRARSAKMRWLERVA